jgi:hypothetical protein
MSAIISKTDIELHRAILLGESHHLGHCSTYLWLEEGEVTNNLHTNIILSKEISLLRHLKKILLGESHQEIHLLLTSFEVVYSKSKYTHLRYFQL